MRENLIDYVLHYVMPLSSETAFRLFLRGISESGSFTGELSEDGRSLRLSTEERSQDLIAV